MTENVNMDPDGQNPDGTIPDGQNPGPGAPEADAAAAEPVNIDPATGIPSVQEGSRRARRGTPVLEVARPVRRLRRGRSSGSRRQST